MRRKARRRRQAGLYGSGQIDWRQRIYEAYDAAQGWIVVTIIGAAIGLNAAFLSIITEWLADIKTGYCSSKFYLNEDFCCWGEENGSKWDCVRLARYVEGGDRRAYNISECEAWRRWTGFEPFNYIIYIIFAVRPPQPISRVLIFRR
jgi:chloride channel 3/4/5